TGGRTQCGMLWENLGGGAGALVGNGWVSFPTPRGQADPGGFSGPVVLLRPFPELGRVASFNVLGNYGGTFHSAAGGDGTLTARISDGTSNTIRVSLAFTLGRQTVTYSCVGDVAADGSFVAV